MKSILHWNKETIFFCPTLNKMLLNGDDDDDMREFLLQLKIFIITRVIRSKRKNLLVLPDVWCKILTMENNSKSRRCMSVKCWKRCTTSRVE